MPRPARRFVLLRQSLATVVAVVLLTLGNTEVASAWGRIGHRASARLAYGLLSPSARRAVDELLEPGESFADAAAWADTIRRERPESGSWHYINVPITADHVNNKYCPEESGCVLSAIRDQAKILSDRSAPLKKRRDALRFVAHFVQDLHQPLHVGDRSDRGGNDLQVQFFAKGSNLHRVWDSGLVEAESDDELIWAGMLTETVTPERFAEWSKGNVRDWAEESLQAARQAYLDPETGQELKAGAKLGELYQAKNLPVARERLARSGVRIARVLNEIFP